MALFRTIETESAMKIQAKETLTTEEYIEFLENRVHYLELEVGKYRVSQISRMLGV